MTQEMTLEELKAQNASAVEETVEEEAVEQPESEAEDHGETEEQQEEQPEAEESEEVESWMQEDVASPSDDETESGFKPNPQAAAVRKKLRAKLSEKDDELEQLKQRLAQYEQGQPQQQEQAQQLPPRPKLEDFDYDEAKHEAALDEWYDKKAEAKAAQVYQSSQSKAEQEAAQRKAQQAREEAVNRHYERAEKLVSEGKVSEEKYQLADRAVREQFDKLKPGQGDAITEHIIDILGDGSEKLMYSLGVNPAKMQEVANVFANDPSGHATIALLSRMQAKLLSPEKRKSSAPKPSAELSQGGAVKTEADALHKKYKNAKDLQTRLDTKRQAKRQGIDVTKW